MKTVFPEIDGILFQDGGYGSDCVNQNAAISERKLPLITPKSDIWFSIKLTVCDFKIVALAAIFSQRFTHKINNFGHTVLTKKKK